MPLDDPQCVICLADLNDVEEVSALACSHSFHTYCLQTYATTTSTSFRHVKCPLCKATSDELLVVDLTTTLPALRPPSSWHGDVCPREEASSSIAAAMARVAAAADALTCAPRAEASKEEPAPAEALACAAPKTDSVTMAASAQKQQPLPDGPAAGTHCPWSTPPVYCSTCGNYATIENAESFQSERGLGVVASAERK